MDMVALELIKSLQHQDKQNEYFIFVKKGPDTNCLKPSANFQIIEVPGLTYADWEQVFLPLYASRYQLDVLHCTSNTAPVFSSICSIITLHDVIFIEKQQTNSSSWYQNLGRLYRKLIVPVVLKKAKKILTVSEFERNRISQVTGIAEQKLRVIYNACGKHFVHTHPESKITEIRNRYKLPGQYIFYLGNTDPKKNLPNTLKAYAHYITHQKAPLPLVIGDLSKENLLATLQENNLTHLSSLIVLTGYIQNSDLPLIYAGAILFLYPSLRESFGIPLLEAMATGTPVVTSSVSALPEIAGGAARLVDPFNFKSIAAGIQQVLTDPTYYRQLIGNGFDRSRQFCWNKSALQLLEVYQNI